MYGKKLCLGLNTNFTNDLKEQIKIIKQTGFEAVFCGYDPEITKECITNAKKENLEFQSIHAPFGGCADLWEGAVEDAVSFCNELISCVNFCSNYEIPIMVSHVYIGFGEHGNPNDQGLYYYGKVIEEAKKAGIKIAFENTEGEEFLDHIMHNFSSYGNVGFCWDTGHEMCYNHSIDMPGRYPGKLIATHLNDNLGIKDFNGKITWHDDLHLLPFDGIADWNGIVKRLENYGFDGTLTFELLNKSKPDRHENDIYAQMPFDVYCSLAYARACKVASLFHK